MKFRPGDLPIADPTEPGTPVEWADNGLSNTMAWASYRILPGWCQSEDHWTSRLTQHLFTDCPCCLLFRGLVVGIAIGAAMVLVGAAIALAAFVLVTR
jgi:hypothetical protein